MLYLGAKKSLLSSGKTLAAQIAAMYAAGEQGFVDDPTLLASLLQDMAGTSPVTAGGQPVGLRLDARLGLLKGPELVSKQQADWSLSSGEGVFSVVNGRITLTGTAAGSNQPFISTAIATVPGKRYTVLYDLVSITGGANRYLKIGLTPGTSSQYVDLINVQAPIGPGNTVSFVAGATTAYLNIATYQTQTIVWDNISIREQPGSAAVQGTAPARPLYQASPARLVFDGVDDAHVTTFAASLGSNCTVVRSVPGVGTTILTGQTIGATYTNTVTHSGLIVINRPLTASETALVTRWGNQRAGV
jgi:hypothetical protein